MVVDSFREFSPPPSLADRVWCFWVQQAGNNPGVPVVSRVVPDGSTRLVYRFGGGLGIFGPRDTPVLRTLEPGTGVVGVRLRPGGRWLLGDVPLSELRGQAIDVDDVPGSWARTLDARLAEAETPRRALAVMAAFLSKRAATAASLDAGIADMVNGFLSDPRITVEDAAAYVGISERQLRRRCVPETGLEPKTLQRLLRFQRVLAHLHTPGTAPETDRTSLATLAFHAGFSDQSHLSNECRSLAGTSLRRFVNETLRRCRHDHDHAAAFAPLHPPMPAMH